MKNLDKVVKLIKKYYKNDEYWNFKDVYRDKLSVYVDLNDKYEVNVLVNIMFDVRENDSEGCSIYFENEIDALSLWDDNKEEFEYDDEDMMSQVESILNGGLDINTLCG